MKNATTIGVQVKLSPLRNIPTVFNHVNQLFGLPQLIQENTETGRRYVTPEGNAYPSVTTVLKQHSEEGIAKWRKKVGDKKADHISRTANRRGTEVHDALERYLNNEENVTRGMMPNAKSVYVHMKKVVDDHVNNIHCLETPLYSDQLKLAGTVDCIAEYDGKLTVIDFKTSLKLKKKAWIDAYFMQLAAYATMYTEHTGMEITNGVIIIGVDNVHFAQIMKVNPLEYVAPLKEYIHKYSNREAA